MFIHIPLKTPFNCVTFQRKILAFRLSFPFRSFVKSFIEEDLHTQLGNELADVIHYTLAIAALNGIDMNDIIINKDKAASIKYNHRTNLEQFVKDKRSPNCSQ